MATSAMAAAAVASYKAQRQMGGVDITYARGADSVSLSVVPGALSDITDANGNQKRFKDFLILASELILDSSTVTPNRKDVITFNGSTYKVTGEGGEPPWRYSDPYEQIIRVHAAKN